MAANDDWDSAEDFLYSFLEPEGLDGSDIIGIGLNFENDNWEIVVHTDDYDFTTDLGSDELPEWVWDDLYYLADMYEWEWDVEYGED